MQLPASRRILLADDHAIVRAGYRALLERHPGCAIVGEAADGVEAYRLATTLQPDLVVLDLSMPGLGGLAVIPRICRRLPACRVLVLSMHADPAYVDRTLRAGAHGYVTKGSEPDTLLRAVDVLLAGGRYLSADLAQQLAWQRLGTDNLEQLTLREFEVLRLLVDARPVAAIARALSLSEKTVLNMHYAIKRKLHARTDIELMHVALRMGLVDLPMTEEGTDPGSEASD